MIAYTRYSSDPRVIREAEVLASVEGYHVTFIVPREGDKPRNHVVNNVNILELNMKTYQGKDKVKYLLSYCSFLLHTFWAVNGLFFKGKADIIHVHNMPDFLVFAAVIPRMFGKKVILDIHDTMPETYASKFGDKKTMLARALCIEESLSCRLAHRIICVNHPQSDVVIGRGIPTDKITICMNVPDHKLFNMVSPGKENNTPSSRFKLVYHGTLAKRLGVDLTIEAVAKLREKIPNLEFQVIGGGDDREEFVKLSRSLNLEENVFFDNSVPVRELPSMLNGMNVGVIANRKNIATELMLPVKMMEYISLDLAVIVPRLKTIQHYFSEEMVSYFEPENVDSLAEAIFKLYSDEGRRIQQIKAARKFLDEYGWENHQMNLLNLYKDLIDGD